MERWFLWARVRKPKRWSGREASCLRGSGNIDALALHQLCPARAGPLWSLWIDRLGEIHEAVNYGAVGKKPDEIAFIVDPIDECALNAEGYCLLRTWGIEHLEGASVSEETVHVSRQKYRRFHLCHCSRKLACSPQACRL